MWATFVRLSLNIHLVILCTYLLSLLSFYIPFSVCASGVFITNFFFFLEDRERALLGKTFHNCAFIYFLFLLTFIGLTSSQISDTPWKFICWLWKTSCTCCVWIQQFISDCSAPLWPRTSGSVTSLTKRLHLTKSPEEKNSQQVSELLVTAFLRSRTKRSAVPVSLSLKKAHPDCPTRLLLGKAAVTAPGPAQVSVI